MKITCQSCQAKYTIADEKVLGKIVKIRCKKCSSTIVVNGSDASGAAVYGSQDAASDAGGQAGGDEGWTVNVGEGDQRTMTDAEIVGAFQSGAIGGETFCWKDGMSDWLPLREIDALFDACNATRAIPSPVADASSATRVHGRGATADVPAAAQYAAAPASSGNGAANGGTARRAGGRAAGADLFHGAAQAGSEEEVMTSAPAGTPQAFDDPKPMGAPTGARNENSVLFSLSALTSKGNDRPPAVPGVEASGLIDIRQLSAQMGRGDDKKRSRVDDIMNLSSGGAFNGALSAPVLAAPSVDQYSGPAAGDAPAEKSKTVIFLALGAAAFVIVAAVGATFLLMHKGTDADGASAAAAAAPSASAAPAVAAGTAPAATATASAAAEPSAAETAAAAPTAAATAAEPNTAAAAPPAAAAEHLAPVAHPQQAVAAAAPVHIAAPAAAPAPAGGGDVAFNFGEAKAKLGAAAASTQSCKKPDGPVGTGRVVVVFAPSGGAQTATLQGPPFDGTPTGACVAARFRGVHVPPFSGSPFSVTKSFTIN
jgi:predicted Zn finger-like uncharacterized protein